MSERPVVAAFDFDGTITYRDTLLPFLWFVTTPWAFCFQLLQCVPTFIGYVMGIVSRQTTKEQVLTQFLAGEQLATIRKKAEAFSLERLNRHVRPEALRRLQWHKNQGHRTVLISANLDVYLQPWGKVSGFDDVISSELQEDEKGRFTGRLKGKNCWGEQKTARLEKLLGPKKDYELYAYGDSLGDKQLLSIADHAFFRKMPI